MIFKLKHQNIAVLITDHNVRETIRMVDRVYIISDGSILAEGDPHEVSKRKDVKEVYLGMDFSW
jgi:lipopolysaccharide export system ATP-binding protein